ncbi:MAG: Alkaline phosphatase [Planctomycetota bacterium]|nr:Alkaline phosphatase [Planctomycetota bacterium]
MHPLMGESIDEEIIPAKNTQESDMKLTHRRGTLGRSSRARRPFLGGSFVEPLERRALLTIALSPAANYGVGSPRGVAIGDFNGDGVPDIVTTGANGGDKSFTVLLGKGDGSFGAPTEFYGGSGPTHVAVGDVNNDGKLDVITTAGVSADVMLGHGDGTFDGPLSYGNVFVPGGLRVADLDGNGNPDIAIANVAYPTGDLLYGRGDGTFDLPATLTSTNNQSDVVAADLFGDGRLDLAVSSPDNVVSVLKNLGGGVFAPPVDYRFQTGSGGVQIVAADFNNDRKNDLAVANSGTSNVGILLNNGDGTFREVNAPGGLMRAESVAVGDIDGDGNTDLVVADGFSGGRVAVFLGHGDGSFAAPQTFDTDNTSYNTFGVAVADLNGDGRPDIVSTNADGVAVLLNETPISAQNSVLSLDSSSYTVDENAGTATVMVDRAGRSSGVVSVHYATRAGTAIPGYNYRDVSGTVTFGDGDSTPKAIQVPILDNANLDLYPNKTIVLSLSQPSPGSLLGSPTTATIGIVDDTLRSLSVNDVTVNEAVGTATFVVSLNTASGLPVTVTAQTSDGTAVAGEDYARVGPIVLTFAPGTTTRTVTVPILNDAVFKSSQVFALNLSSPTNAVIARAQGTGTIIDNDAPLIIRAATVTAVENQPFFATLGSFVDPNGTSPSDSYVVSIQWGDSPGNELTTVQSNTRTVPVVAPHLYAHEGVYAISVSVVKNGPGFTGIFTDTFFSQAVVSDGALAVQAANLTPLVGIPFTTNVASYQDAGGFDDPSSYVATIDYGDGTLGAPGSTQAAISTDANAPLSGFISGTHTYATAGTYDLAVTLRSAGGGVITGSQLITVRNVPPAPGFLSGFLNPASDSGVSNSDAITNVTQPNFEGFATPGATVKYFAQASGGTPFQIGQGAADSSGFYSTTSFNPLADGQYTITASFSNVAGVSSTSIQVLPGGGKGPLIIDTVAPRTTSLLFDRLKGTLRVGFRDDGSGLDVSSLLDGANFRLSSPHTRASTTVVNGVALNNDPTGGSNLMRDVTLTFNHGRKLKYGVYTFIARSGGIRDVAGNALDGEFYGRFPTGNGHPGGDFAATLASHQRVARAPGTATATVKPTEQSTGASAGRVAVHPAVLLARLKSVAHSRIGMRHVAFVNVVR